VDKISEQVQQYNLSKFVPLVRVEKGARRQTFYFFLAIESLQLGEIPTEVESNLLRLPFFKYPIKGNPSFTYEQIKPMVGIAHNVYDYTNPIPYQSVQKVTYDNPFDLIASTPINQSLPDIEALSHRYEQLLYWLSALGSGTWESFKKACDALRLEEPKRILQRLRLLGHIESSLDGSRWSMAPTALVKVRSQPNSQEFILCGQRSINLLKELELHATVELSKQPRGEAPLCVCLHLANSNILSHLVEHSSSQFCITNAGEVSSQLARILPDIATWKQSLRSLQGIVPSLYEWKRFDGNNFVSCISPSETGMYQMWTTETSDRPRYTLFYDQESNSWRQGDWYGLRFLGLQHNDQQCVAHYDFVTGRLAILVSQRWPELYERALVLASGRLPTYQDSWLLYENVGLEVVCQLTDKLNVKWEEASTRA
jgi:hypothetical protein